MTGNTDKQTYQIVGLKEQRVELGLGKAELGRIAGVSARTIANAEKEDGGAGVREETANRIISALSKRREEIGKPKITPDIIPVERPKKKKKKKDEI